jgi:hypothetical protein
VSESKKSGTLKLRRVVWFQRAGAGATPGVTTTDTVGKVVLEVDAAAADPRRKSEAAAAPASDVATLKVHRSSSIAASIAPVSPRTPRSPRPGDETTSNTIALQLPSDLTPSCQSTQVRVAYQLHFIVRSRFFSDQTVSIPLKIIA